MAKAPFILLVNPWITDFAAYDLWAKPLGLLLLASLLRDAGCGVAFLDCLQRRDRRTLQHPEVIAGCNRKYGTGKYPKVSIDKPQAYAEMPRYYYRHGIHAETLAWELKSIPKPDLIWITSVMTYWYPGVQQSIAMIREIFPDVPIWLGGIYAQLCSSHASKTSGADQVITDAMGRLPEMIELQTGFDVRNKDKWNSLVTAPYPALDLLPEFDYAPILASRGCLYSCPYCASKKLQPKWERRGENAIFDEIVKWHQEYGIQDFAFYDDALLLSAETSLKPALERVYREGLDVRFHTPNALHIRALTPEWSSLLYRSGFTTIRLGLETSRADKQKEWGDKVDTAMFFTAMHNLTTAGFCGSQIGVYLLAGLPGQTPEDVQDAIDLVRTAGAQPHLAEYSPVPGTPMWGEAVASSNYGLDFDPLYHNNSFFACRRADFSYQDLFELKKLAREARMVNPIKIGKSPLPNK